jgi:2-polyprenyl-3-methyl-5-hydroxy-6-metoxy-1,4-benzoquinol methylase/GNAT superfamily N-acetyltransferase
MLSQADGKLHFPPNADFSWLLASEVNDDILQECSKLYSENYGLWGEHGQNPGERIKLSVPRLKIWLEAPNSWVALARDHKSKSLIAYAFATKMCIPGKGFVSWVTQLVVSEDYRNMGYSKRLLNGIWSFSNYYAWGLVTASPYAVRALEKATRRRCNPEVIARLGEEVVNAGRINIRYVDTAKQKLNTNESVLDTEFFVSRNGMDEMLANASHQEEWKLGKLEKGEEWFAFTFNEQTEFVLQPQELESILADADDIAKRAYEGMALDDEHRWMRHTSSEVEYITSQGNLKGSESILDFGCGTGRHSLEFALRGYKVLGVDFVQKLVDQAKQKSRDFRLEDHAIFVTGDCRHFNAEQEFDVALCLYDVIGTFPDSKENILILENLVKQVKMGGLVAISVLNSGSVIDVVQRKVSLRSKTKELLELPPSTTMQETGQIFNPDTILIDTDTGIFYRKEQFDNAGTQLPCELIVRDLRYSLAEIEAMCSRVGLRKIICKPVQTGGWNASPSLSEKDKKAKEILYIGYKVANPDMAALADSPSSQQLELFKFKSHS